MTASQEKERLAGTAVRPQDDLMVRATDITKTYDTGRVKVRALRGVTLSVKRGEIIAIMGPSGCGKTTLLNCLSGLDSIDSGTILIDGSDINRLSDNQKTDFRARRMGFVFQFYNLLPVLSSIENVELPLLVSGTSFERGAQARPRGAGAGAPDGVGAAPAGGAFRRPASAHHRGAGAGERPGYRLGRRADGRPGQHERAGDHGPHLRAERQRGQTFVLVTHDAKIAARTHRIVYMVDGLIVDEKLNS